MKNMLYVVGSLLWMGTCMAADDFEFFQSVRQNQPHVTSLSFHRRSLTSLDPLLKYFPNLKALRIEKCWNTRHLIPTLSLLAAGLRTLSIPSSGVVDLDGIQSLKNLEVLNVSASRSWIQSMKPLAELPLKYLNLGGQSHIKDLEYIRQLQKLKRLSLASVFYDDMNYPSLDLLEHLVHLTHLNLSTNPAIDDLSPVFKITTLKSLILTGVHSRIDGIENLKNLEYLGLGMLCDYGDRSYLSKLSKLKSIQAYPGSDERLEILRSYLLSHIRVEKELNFPGWDW